MDPGSTPVAARTRSSLDSFNNLLSRLPENNDHEHGRVREHVVDNLTRFKIWAGSIGAYHVDNRSADHRLREAPEIQQRVLELLDEVLEANQELLASLTGESHPVGSCAEDNDGSPDVHADEDLIEICLTIGDVISSLLKVSGLLRKATGRDRYAKAVASREPAFLEEFDIRHVECKYPKVSRSPKLAEKLGRANVLRRQYLRYARKHHARLAYDPIRPLRPDVVPTGPTNTLSVSGIEQRTLTSTRPTLGQTEASTLLVDFLPKIESGGFDTENLEELRSQATSVMTSNAGYREREGLEVIPLSEVSKDGHPFECPYCWTIVQSQRQRSWKRHVLRGIRAWTCTFSDCAFGLFEDRESWFQHELEYHRRQWECASCAGALFGSCAEMEGHVLRHHPAISASALPHVLAASSRPKTEIPVTACPLCDEWENHLNQKSSCPEAPAGVELTVPARVFEEHLGHHLVQLALFSIPPTLETTVESKSTRGEKYVGVLEEWQNGVEADQEVPDEVSVDYTEASRPESINNSEAAPTNLQRHFAAPQIQVQGLSANDEPSNEALQFPAYHNAEPSSQRENPPNVILRVPGERILPAGTARVIRQFSTHAELLGDICASLPYLQGTEYVEDILSSLAKCQAITMSIAESFQSMEAGVIGQVEDICDDSLQYIDDAVQRIMSKSSAAVEVRHEIESIRESANQVYEHLVSLYDRLGATFGMASSAQSSTPHRELQHLDGEGTRSPGLLEPPAEASLTFPELPKPVIFTSSSADQHTPPAEGPDFQQVADVLASQAALVQDLCERFNLWDDSRFTGALVMFSDIISLVKAVYPRDAQNVHLLHRQCIEILQNLEHDVERLTRDVPIHSRALEAVTAINERLALLHELFLDVSGIANA